jgi:hypothetical protein
VNHVENTRSVASGVATGSSVAGGTVALTVDTLGYGYLSVDAVYSTCVVASAVASIFTLEAADTTAALATYTATYGSVTAVTSVANTAAAQTSTPTIMRFDFDLRGKPRYIRFATAPNDTNARAVIVGRLSKGADGPDSADEKNTRLKFSN